MVYNFTFQKEAISGIYGNMAEPGRHYSKGTEPGIKRHTVSSHLYKE
jgi:hypothetical protein